MEIQNDSAVRCAHCGESKPVLSNTQRHGWICDMCISELELMEQIQHERQRPVQPTN
jgi:hypothetical protein